MPKPAPAKGAAPRAATVKAVPVKTVLPNGLTLVVQENRAAPVVAVRMYVRTGSIYEGRYLGAGISHLFEHTLSEGTKTRTKEQINDDIQGMGGQSNAYTTYDVTAYHITTAAPFFERAVASLADMAQNATFPEAEVRTQQGVIHNEMNLDEDDPDRTLSELFYATAFRVHPIRYPIIGYPEVFDRLTRDDILNYYQSHYTPENSVISVAGDINSSAAIAALTRAFGSWPRRSASTPALPTEPQQTSARRATLEKDVNLSYMQVGWHTIPLQHDDLYALDTLAQILGGGESSRLVRTVRERENLVSEISAYSSTPNFNAGVFAVRATMTPGNERKVEGGIWREIGKIWREGVTQQELQRAQRQIETNFIFHSDSVEEQAEQIAYDELGTGDPSYSRQYVQRIKAVTPAQIQDVARRYLTREGGTTVQVVPRGSVRASGSAAPTRAAALPPQIFRLPNGMRLIVRENHSAPTVSVVAMGVGGIRAEPADKNGLSNLFAQMLVRGSAKRNAEQLAGLVDDLGGTLTPFSGYNTWGLQSQWLSRDWRRGLSLVADSMLESNFPDSELGRLKNQVSSQIRAQNDDPMSAASKLLRRTYFGSHPYGRPSLGTAESIKGITRADLQGFWNRNLLPRSLVLSVYGDVNAEEVRRAAVWAFRNFKRAGSAPAEPAPASRLTKFTEAIQTKPGLAQSVQFFAFPSVDVRNKDRYALDVLDAALSGADLPGGRLHARLRDNQLVYVVHAFDQPGVDPGMFVIYAASTRDNRQKVRDIILEEIARVRDADISAEELERAKAMAIAAAAINNQTNSSQASQAASDELFGLGYRNSERYAAAINAITLADVRRAAQQYLRPGSAAYSLVEAP